MKAYLAVLSSLCFCTILLYLFVYEKGQFSMPNLTSATVDSLRFYQQTPVPAIHQPIGMQAPMVKDDSSCDSCIERLSLVFETLQEEPEAVPDSRSENKLFTLSEVGLGVAKDIGNLDQPLNSSLEN